MFVLTFPHPPHSCGQSRSLFAFPYHTLCYTAPRRQRRPLTALQAAPSAPPECRLERLDCPDRAVLFPHDKAHVLPRPEYCSVITFLSPPVAARQFSPKPGTGERASLLGEGHLTREAPGRHIYPAFLDFFLSPSRALAQIARPVTQCSVPASRKGGRVPGAAQALIPPTWSVAPAADLARKRVERAVPAYINSIIGEIGLCLLITPNLSVEPLFAGAAPRLLHAGSVPLVGAVCAV